MTTDNIKSAILEKVKKLSSYEAKRVYGMILEHNINDSLFYSFEELPPEHKLILKKGINDLQEGRKQKANEFIKDIRKKYA